MRRPSDIEMLIALTNMIRKALSAVDVSSRAVR